MKIKMSLHLKSTRNLLALSGATLGLLITCPPETLAQTIDEWISDQSNSGSTLRFEPTEMPSCQDGSLPQWGEYNQVFQDRFKRWRLGRAYNIPPYLWLKDDPNRGPILALQAIVYVQYDYCDRRGRSSTRSKYYSFGQQYEVSGTFDRPEYNFLGLEKMMTVSHYQIGDVDMDLETFKRLDFVHHDRTIDGPYLYRVWLTPVEPRMSFRPSDHMEKIEVTFAGVCGETPLSVTYEQSDCSYGSCDYLPAFIKDE